jgi:hypothetical protein
MRFLKGLNSIWNSLLNGDAKAVRANNTRFWANYNSVPNQENVIKIPQMMSHTQGIAELSRN